MHVYKAGPVPSTLVFLTGRMIIGLSIEVPRCFIPMQYTVDGHLVIASQVFAYLNITRYLQLAIKLVEQK